MAVRSTPARGGAVVGGHEGIGLQAQPGVKLLAGLLVAQALVLGQGVDGGGQGG